MGLKTLTGKCINFVTVTLPSSVKITLILTSQFYILHMCPKL